jgi:hypothetical protein
MQSKTMTNVNELGKMGIRETPFFIKKGVSRTLPPKNFYSEGIFMARSAKKCLPICFSFEGSETSSFLWKRKVSEKIPPLLLKIYEAVVKNLL